ncbi:MAG: hypothetical protein FJZ97_14315, partial [Chloroflexi bacterium]|nr:hypothetical protein [Chloroflexota bacterium]
MKAAARSPAREGARLGTDSPVLQKTDPPEWRQHKKGLAHCAGVGQSRLGALLNGFTLSRIVSATSGVVEQLAQKNAVRKRRGRALVLYALAAAALALNGLGAIRLSQETGERIDYYRDVHSILAARCLGCHSQEKRSGGLSLATYEDILDGGRNGTAVRPGRSDDSLVIRRLNGSVSPTMPLGGEPLAGLSHFW